MAITSASSAASPAADSGDPRASVVMTAYNDLRFIEAAVDSILQQQFCGLELIIVDDGTGEDAIFQALARRDPRIRLVVNPANMGTAAAANRGIEHARGDIIVRLDADDIAEPERVARLVAALAEDPQLGLVGSAVLVVDEAGRPRGVVRMPETDVEIRWTILFQNPFYHSTVAYRRSCFEAAGRYRSGKFLSEDHYLWFDMLPVCRAQNLADPLTRYRVNPRGLTATNAKNDPRGRTHAIREILWGRLGLSYDLYDEGRALDVTHFVRGYDIAAPERRAAAYRVILTVLRAFLAQRFTHGGDAETARRMGRAIAARILGNPPAELRKMLAICCLCWPIDRFAAIRAALGCVASKVNALTRSATRAGSRSVAC